MYNPITVMRLWSKVSFSSREKCWPWMGAIDRGYGRFYVKIPGRRNPKAFLAHVVAFEVLSGPKPSGSELHHKCNNKSCVNPWHLQLLTHGKHMETLRKSVCIRGHNDWVFAKRGKRTRYCLTCSKESNRKSYLKRKNKRKAKP